MDTINTPTIRKKLKKLSAQDPEESRKRWQFVTEALLNRDVEAATEAKHTVSHTSYTVVVYNSYEIHKDPNCDLDVLVLVVCKATSFDDLYLHTYSMESVKIVRGKA